MLCSNPLHARTQGHECEPSYLLGLVSAQLKRYRVELRGKLACNPTGSRNRITAQVRGALASVETALSALARNQEERREASLLLHNAQLRAIEVPCQV